KELIIVCVSTLCILTMITMKTVEAEEYVEKNKSINALAMKSDGVDIGIVLSENIGNSALDVVKDIYVNKANIDNIKDVALNNKILYENIVCNENEILTEEEVTNKIIEHNNANDQQIVSFTVTKENKVKYIKVKSNNDQVAFTTLSQGNTELNRQVFLHNSMTTPVSGILTSTFGEQRNGYNHKGIDLAADSGTSIQAALDGKVSFSGVEKGYGNVVIIDHKNNLQTVYAHCSKLNVSVGEWVSTGQVIAEVGSTGDSTGPHLHFEIKVDGNNINPLEYNGSNEY
ncbi:M23 family metallopeptidase, partial [Clostridium sp.]|uniref:M23 family metallopeptidase n=1 Tax=Clostridium sp. TaxID=1506 RepID=UPI003216CF10